MNTAHWTTREEKARAAYCEVAERILANNQPLDGIAGVFDLSPGKFKRLAASTIIAVRRNRIACKEMGLNWHAADARLLEKAARFRRLAAGGILPLPVRGFVDGFSGAVVVEITRAGPGK